MFDAETLRAVEALANDLNVKNAALLAVAEVESNGHVYAMVKGKREPLIRWEGHYFDQRLVGAKRDQARRQKLASPKAGAVKNPKFQTERWELVTRAAKIDRQAALESFSIGLGQVMTAHWRKLGFKSVDDMIKMARSGAAGQIEIMARYIKNFGLADELQRLDFSAFARAYNGPNYRKYGYHTKMANAYARISGKTPVSAANGMLRMGSRGEKVRTLQTLLVRAGYSVTVDGDYGPATRTAVRSFQRLQKITVDGVAGPETFRRLEQWKQAPDENPGSVPISEVTEVKDAAKGLGPVALVTAVHDKIAEASGWLLGLEAETAQAVANGLMAASSIIGAGLALWALYGWWKNRTTDEGDIFTGETVEDADEVLV